MAQLKYCDKHNQVGFLRKPDESARFAEIVDFLRGSNLRDSLQLDDATGITMLPNAELFEELRYCLLCYLLLLTQMQDKNMMLWLHPNHHPVPSTSSPPVITTPTPPPIPTPPTISTPTPPPIPTPPTIPTPTPIPDTEPTPFEHIYEEPSPVHHHFSPPQEQA
ncbi:hypothetical protein Tco_1305148, partial [Tanacetum coccineum]